MIEDDFSSPEFSEVTNFKANPAFPFLDKMDIDLDVRRRVSLSLEMTLSGNDQVLTTPLCKSKSPDAILRDIDAIFERNMSKINPALMEIENSNRSKFGPRSISKPWSERIEGLSEYFGSDECSIAPRDLFPGSLNNLKPCLRPLSIKSAVDCLKNSTNSGFPYYTRKGKLKERYIENFESLLKRKDPCILFTRTQEGGKTRDVWGYPMADSILEMRYYRPLLEYQRKLNWRGAIISPDEVDRRITRLMDFAKSNDLVLVSVDFKGFDKSLRKTLQACSFRYIKCLFQVKDLADLDYIEDRFSTIGIVTPGGIFTGTHGVPSGSTFTNEVDSIAQYLVAKSSGITVEDLIQIQGDDGVYAIPRDKLDEFLSHFNNAGLTVNRDKSVTSDVFCVYLQQLYHPDYRCKSSGIIGGVYSIYRALNRLLFQENWSRFEDFNIIGRDYYSIRAISILENCRNHPLFEDFVMYIKQLDKYSLGVSRNGISDYIKFMSDSQGAEGILKNQYGDDIKGIRSFKTWKLLM
uniref:RdRp n=1 Tax=Shahe picobirna-like virus 2 TaxID=1923438 RepID=A0A1L3KLI0_9VIRU|nr:RdRp [Shahe picobirna-like virus 2]